MTLSGRKVPVSRLAMKAACACTYLNINYVHSEGPCLPVSILSDNIFIGRAPLPKALYTVTHTHTQSKLYKCGKVKSVSIDMLKVYTTYSQCCHL